MDIGNIIRLVSINDPQLCNFDQRSDNNCLKLICVRLYLALIARLLMAPSNSPNGSIPSEFELFMNPVVVDDDAAVFDDDDDGSPSLTTGPNGLPTETNCGSLTFVPDILNDLKKSMISNVNQ